MAEGYKIERSGSWKYGTGQCSMAFRLYFACVAAFMLAWSFIPFGVWAWECYGTLFFAVT